ncbi:MAG: PhzF family phenazine biosynthesis protein, partial [Proteobacteria bacterium]|nr:PhzF family phenazine biosynthesis protein [Pseudomonadota bacterium]
MEIPFFHIDAFTGEVFSGNPAGVCLLAHWPVDALLQQIAAENNLPETAFIVQQGESYAIRWFSPQTEIDLCGHATLAAVYALFNSMGFPEPVITFVSPCSGKLQVGRKDYLYTLDFPSRPAVACDPIALLTRALGVSPLETWRAADYLCVFVSEDEVRSLRPDFSLLRSLDLRGVIATARGKKHDFVSRFFAPALGIDEDPVTGSSHCTLIP